MEKHDVNLRGRKRQAHSRAAVRRFGRRILSLLLCLGVFLPSVQGASVPSLAAEPKDGAVYLQSSRIPSDKLPEGDYIYFGTAAATVEEKGEYAVKLYREGNLEKEASVDLHTIDLMAVYGEDYELAMDGVKESGNGGSILENYVKGKEITHTDNLAAFAAPGEAQEETAPAKPEDAQMQNAAQPSGEGEDGRKDEGAVSAAEVSPLAREKEEQTGGKARELTGTEEQSLMDEIMGDLVADSMQQLDYSSESTVTFGKGEGEKTVKFRILPDDKSEGMEGFSLLLVNPQEAELYEVTSLSVSITDAQKAEHSEVSFSEAKYASEEGRARVTVQRTGAEYSVCEMALRTSGVTAVAGTNYEEKNELVSFAPYEMEKDIELEVAGNGDFQVMLTDLRACEEGARTKALVEIREESGAAGAVVGDALQRAAVENLSSFDINIKGHAYTVEYEEGQPTGRIMDNDYEPAVQAGTYYFAADSAHNGIFEYGHLGGDMPNSTGHRETDYQSGGKYGRLRYYSSLAWQTGWVFTRAKDIPGVYYSYFIPDWDTDGSTDGGQRKIEATGADTVYTRGETGGRTQNGSAVVNKYDGDVTADIYAYDDSGYCRKSYIKFYGLCAMNRKFNISMLPVNQSRFRTGEAGSYVDAPPVQVEVDCGAQPKDANMDSRDIYANQNPDMSNLVFNIKPSHVNGHYGFFGHLTGYQITIDPGKGTDKNVTLNYPDDFEAWLTEEMTRKVVRPGIPKPTIVEKKYPRFPQEEVDAELKKIRQSLGTVPYDKYFLEWISDKQKDVADDELSYGYKQNLKFKPLFEYNDVTVEVLPAVGTGTGHFKDSQLSQTGKYAFHAGDSLSLEGVADEPDKNEVIGYQVSTDGSHFNTITDGSQLFLGDEQDKNYYYIRPVIARNVIEVKLDRDAASHFEVQGLVSREELLALGEDFKELADKNILIANPQGKTTLEKITPVPGKNYMVRILEKDGGDSATVYRPTVKQKTRNTTYTTQLFQFMAGVSIEDNVIEIGASKVAKDKLHQYAIGGSLISSYGTIRSDGLEMKHLPVMGYTLSAGTGVQKLDKENHPYVESVASVSDDTGYYYLEGITGVEGDVVPVYVSNGITSGQIMDVVLSDRSEDKDKGIYKVTQENTEIKYPYGAPKVISIDYTYDNASHIQSNGGVAPNNVNVYDDIFTVTAAVDTFGRRVKEAVFTVYTVNGKTTEYRAQEDPDNPNHYVCRIAGMADSIFNGDRIRVRLVDEETIYSGASKDKDGNDVLNNEGEPVTGIEKHIEYPDVDTGLSFYVENVLTQPKYYDVENDETVANIPLIGNATSSTQSGLLTFGKTRWGDGSGYTLQIGVDATFGNTASVSGQQKAALYDNFMSAVRTDKNAEEIMLSNLAKGDKDAGDGNEGSGAGGDPGSNMSLKEEKKQVENAIDKQKADNTSKAKGALAKMNEKEPMWKVDAAFLLAFDFLYNPQIGDYQFVSGGVAVGGTFTFNMTTYGMVASVPAFLNFSSTLQANLTVAYATETGKAAMTASDFDSYSGNLAERLSGTKATQSIMASGKIQVGVGLCGVLSARGYVSLKVQFDIGLTKDTPSGILLGSAGGIGFDVLIVSVDIDFYNVTKGWGSLANRTNYDFFGGLLDEGDLGLRTASDQVFSLNQKSAKTAATGLFAFNGNGDKVLKDYGNNERLVEHTYDTGSSDMSKFGRSSQLRAAPSLVRVNTLMENAAERTRPQIIALDDSNGRKMMVFMGSRGSTGSDAPNDAALYYSVYDGQVWGMPKLVDQDGTVDSMPDVVRTKGTDGKEKIVIAWADASRAFTADDSTIDKLNTMGISAIVYDIESNTMGEKIPLVQGDRYLNLSPKLNVADGVIYCSYMKRDLTRAEGEEELLDVTGIYSVMAHVAYDTKDGTFVSGTQDTHEEYINIYHPDSRHNNDPLVMDYQSVTTELDGDTYLLSTYTVDGDMKLDTKEDRELFLTIYNITQEREYYPIQVTNDALGQSNPQLTDIDGTVYLTWLDDGYLFRMADVSVMLEALFGKSTEQIEIAASENDGGQAVSISINKDVYRNGHIPAGTGMQNAVKYKDWCKKSATELGIADAQYYDETVYAQLANGELQTECVNFSQREGMQTSVSNYILTSNGKDIFVFFTDFGTKDEKSTGVEIYGASYRRWLGDGGNAEGGGSGGSEGDGSASGGSDVAGTDNIDLEQDWGFGKAVQITDNGKVIDELSLYMDRDSNISAVSNYYEQYINEDGGMSYSKNKLVEMEFTTTGSIEVEDGCINLPKQLESGRTEEVSFDVVNQGLLTAKGFQYGVYQVQNGTETFIDGGEVIASLGSGEKRKVTALWEVPEDLTDTQIRVDVQEIDVENIVVNSASVQVPYSGNLEFTETQVLWDGLQPYLSTTVRNTGNAATKPYQASLGICDNDGNMTKVYKTVSIPALGSGEEKSFREPIALNVDDFADDLGILRLRFAAMDGEKVVAQTNTKLTSLAPVCAQINDGKDIALSYNKSVELTVNAAPWNSIAGDVRFYSTDAGIAFVDDAGKVTGTGNGTAKIIAYYPNSGVTASIGVTVTGKPEDENPDPGKTDPDKTDPDKTDPDNRAETGTARITLKKASAVVAPGKTVSLGFTANKDSNAKGAEKVSVFVSGKSVVSKAAIKGSKVQITAAKKAVRGSSTTVTLKSTNAAGKTVSAKIKISIQNPVKKVTAKKEITVKRGRKVKLVLNVTAQNKKKATTDTVKVSSNIVALESYSAKKGKVTVVLKGKKKGKKTVAIKIGKRSVKVKVQVK